MDSHISPVVSHITTTSRTSMSSSVVSEPHVEQPVRGVVHNISVESGSYNTIPIDFIDTPHPTWNSIPDSNT